MGFFRAWKIGVTVLRKRHFLNKNPLKKFRWTLVGRNLKLTGLVYIFKKYSVLKYALKTSDGLGKKEKKDQILLLLTLMSRERRCRQLYNWIFMENWIPFLYNLSSEWRLVTTLAIDSEVQLKFGNTKPIHSGCMQNKKANSFLE